VRWRRRCSPHPPWLTRPWSLRCRIRRLRIPRLFSRGTCRSPPVIARRGRAGAPPTRHLMRRASGDPLRPARSCCRRRRIEHPRTCAHRSDYRRRSSGSPSALDRRRFMVRTRRATRRRSPRRRASWRRRRAAAFASTRATNTQGTNPGVARNARPIVGCGVTVAVTDDSGASGGHGGAAAPLCRRARGHVV